MGRPSFAPKDHSVSCWLSPRYTLSLVRYSCILILRQYTHTSSPMVLTTLTSSSLGTFWLYHSVFFLLCLLQRPGDVSVICITFQRLNVVDAKIVVVHIGVDDVPLHRWLGILLIMKHMLVNAALLPASVQMLLRCYHHLQDKNNPMHYHPSWNIIHSTHWHHLGLMISNMNHIQIIIQV